MTSPDDWLERSGPAQYPGDESMFHSRDSADLLSALRQLIEATVKEQIGGAGGSSSNGAWSNEAPGLVTVDQPDRIDPRDYADDADAGFDFRRFLQQQNPYGVESVDPTGPIETIGPARQNGYGRPLRKSLQEFTPFEVDECPRWSFGPNTYRVTKALRVPYSYTHPQTGARVRASILIGFQGPGY